MNKQEILKAVDAGILYKEIDEIYHNRGNWTARVRELISMNYKIIKGSRSNLEVHTKDVKDITNHLNDGFGNPNYKTHFSRLYVLEGYQYTSQEAFLNTL